MLLNRLILLFIPLYVSPLFAVVVNDGSTLTLNGGNFNATAVEPAEWAYDGTSTIISNGANATSLFSNIPAVQAGNAPPETPNGQITLNGGLISTTATNSDGLYATQNGIILAYGPQIFTNDSQSAGAFADTGGSITFNGGTIVTSGTFSPGIETQSFGSISGPVSITTTNDNSPAMSAQGGAINFGGGNIVTNGSSSPGFTASSAGTLTGQGFSLQTTGAGSYAVFATGTDTAITLSSGSMQTNALGSIGAFATDSASISLSNLSLTTLQSQSPALVADTNGTVSLSSASANTSGADSPAVSLADGGTVNISNASANAQGVNSPGLSATGPGSSSTLNLINASLYSNQSDAMVADNAIVDINANAGTISANNNILISAINGSTATITGINNSRFTGEVVADASTVNITLINSTWSGSSQNLTDLTLGRTGVWEMDQNSTLTGTVLNAGIIEFTQPSPSFKTLTFAGPYVGLNGAIILNTTLNGDNNSPTDLIVLTNLATGSTGLVINDFNGLGEETVNGILIVNGEGAPPIENNTFFLAEPVVAGPYEYLLFLGADNNLYLSNTAPPINGIDPPSANGPRVPIYRLEVFLFTAIPTSILAYDRTLLSNLHQRTGDTFYAQNNGLRRWTRYIHHYGGSLKSGSIYGSGPNFQFRTNIVQFGGDFYNASNKNNHFISGIFGALGTSHNNVDYGVGYSLDNLAAPFVKNTGYDHLDGTTVGGYCTFTHQEHFYLDAVIQGTHFNVTANSARGRADVKGDTISGSLESGYNIYLGELFSIQPQVQIVARTWALQKAEVKNATIHFGNNTMPIATRIGLLTEYFHSNYDLDLLSVWLRANYWHYDNVETQTYFSSRIGDVVFKAKFPKEIVEAEGGITVQINNLFAVFGTVSRHYSLSSRGQASTFNAGITINL